MAIILLKIFFFKKFQKPYLDRKWGNDICSWQCSSDSDKPVKQYGIQDDHDDAREITAV